MRISTTLLTLALLAASVPARAEDAATSPGTKRLTDKLAAEYKVPAADIDRMRSDKMGWGEIGHALAVSQKAGVPLSDVLAQRKAGSGWGVIAQKYGFKLGDVARRAKDVEREGRDADRDDAGRRHERAERHERHESPRAEHAGSHGGAGGGHGHGGGRGR